MRLPSRDGLATALSAQFRNVKIIEEFEKAGGIAKPRYGQITVCYSESEEAAAKIVREQWPNAGIRGPLMVGLATPAHFEAVAEVMAAEKSPMT
jgi:hypothetical protein